MSGRIAARYVSRRFSSGGKVFSEEEKAAENIYIKKMEHEKLEKLARKGPIPAEAQATGSGPTVAEGKASGPDPSSTPKVSSDKNRNYAVLAGVITAASALGWYLKSGSKKTEEVQD